MVQHPEIDKTLIILFKNLGWCMNTIITMIIFLVTRKQQHAYTCQIICKYVKGPIPSLK